MFNFILPFGLALGAAFSGDSAHLHNSACVFVHTLMRHSIQSNDDSPVLWKFIDLGQNYLRTFMPVHHIAPVTKILEEQGIIEVNHSYSTGGVLNGSYVKARPKAYRFKRPWDRCLAEIVPASKAIQDEKASRRVSKRLSKAVEKDINPPTHIQRVLFDNLERIEIDVDRATQAAEKHCETKNDLRHAFKSITDIANRQWYFTEDTGGRVYNNFVGLYKELRPYITIYGKPFRKVDISSMQPYLLGVLYAKAKRGDLDCGEISYTCITNQVSESNLIHSLYTMYEIYSEPAFPPEIADYMGMVLQGKIYQIWADLGGYASKDEAKLPCISYINDTDGIYQYWQGKPIMEKVCPAMAAFVACFQGKKDLDGKSLLTKMLHVEESEYIINDVCVCLNQQNPDMPLLTVHDCIATTDEYVPAVEDMLKKRGDARFGKAPHFKTDERLGAILAA